ncbi:arginine/serine-rich coiled-coil protein 2-like isoform X1 [Argiope bruennichi]|uniref:arginine/serine-rich coiled-coil protein 2-like isoform X1 n=1 Tax=Argiope bruennichi TaxID=94029 RepID=UPI0024940105|nr:arginine/serine-rich coiled-coil protein 2-like isoform X1 [Argiope bruennichi]
MRCIVLLMKAFHNPIESAKRKHEECLENHLFFMVVLCIDRCINFLLQHGTSSAKASSSGVSYDTHTSEVKSDSSSSSDDENGFVLRGDSNSLKRSFRKRGSSSASEEVTLEDATSPQFHSGSLTRERLLPSIYDDDAQSGNPSGIFEKKDLAFRSSFNSSYNRSPDSSPSFGIDNKTEKLPGLSLEHSSNEQNHESKSSSPKIKNYNEDRSRKSPFDGKSSKCRSPDKRSRYSRSRSKSHDKRNGRRSRSHSRSKDKRTKSPHDERRRSRSKDRKSGKDRRRLSRSKRSRSRDSRRRSRSHSRESRRQSRSRSRDSRRRSRSRSFDRHRGSRYGGRRRSSSRDKYRRKRYSRSRSRSRDRSKGGSSCRKPGSLPLSTSAGAMTPQMALQQTMAAMSAKAQALTGIALPKYYNPAAVNPLKYAEQVQKRKLLWQPKEKVEEQQKNTVWDKLTFAQDQDGKMTAKFRKLMGIKSETTTNETEDSVLKRQEVIFQDLDKQYEMARMTTHTQRGVGLGYSAQTLYPPVQK